MKLHFQSRFSCVFNCVLVAFWLCFKLRFSLSDPTLLFLRGISRFIILVACVFFFFYYYYISFISVTCLSLSLIKQQYCNPLYLILSHELFQRCSFLPHSFSLVHRFSSAAKIISSPLWAPLLFIRRSPLSRRLWVSPLSFLPPVLLLLLPFFFQFTFVLSQILNSFVHLPFFSSCLLLSPPLCILFSSPRIFFVFS